jgi:thiosulfate/3-mercaptopyruvate sulfurtransferase
VPSVVSAAVIRDDQHLVDAASLARESRDESVVVVDCRWYLDGRSGRGAFLAGHIPGAVWVDVDADLAGPAGAECGRHPLPSPADFAAAMARAGIGDDMRVVAYDDAGGSIAARLWWMLRSVGVRAAVLDGGIGAWEGPLESGPARPVPARFTPRPWPEALYVDTADVHPARRPRGTVLVDARAAERFRGEDTTIDPRPGHIPGAVNLPWPENLDPVTGRMRPVTDLRVRYARIGALDADRVVASCGSGVTACHDLLAMTLAGVGPLALYTGSWSAWSSDPGRPAALGGGNDAIAAHDWAEPS